MLLLGLSNKYALSHFQKRIPNAQFVIVVPTVHVIFETLTYFYTDKKLFLLFRQQYANELISDLIDDNEQKIRQKDLCENY